MVVSLVKFKQYVRIPQRRKRTVFRYKKINQIDLVRDGRGLPHTHTHTHTQRQLRSQGPVSVPAHRTEGVTGSKGQERANGVGGGNRDGNGVGGGNGDLNGHGGGEGAGAGTRTGVEVNEGAQDGNGGWSGDGDGGGDP